MNYLEDRSPCGEFDTRLWRLEVRPRNIYVAASMNAQTEALRFALRLIDAGFSVTSSWLRKDFGNKPSPHKWQAYFEYEAKWGEVDLADLERADTLVVLANESSSSGGYHCELGYFLGAKRSNIVVVGDKANVFYFTSSVRWAPSDHDLVEWLCAPEHGEVVAAPVTSFEVPQVKPGDLEDLF